MWDFANLFCLQNDKAALDGHRSYVYSSSLCSPGQQTTSGPLCLSLGREVLNSCLMACWNGVMERVTSDVSFTTNKVKISKLFCFLAKYSDRPQVNVTFSYLHALIFEERKGQLTASVSACPYLGSM